ncbi:MAG TPA: DUF1922 domain-containing protein [Thermoplasmata archaeon]|nr:DUF1922 domain-containing protein [Thermoplasmata archaeon]
MFGVVVCPRCGRAKGIELPKKTTSCPCGFEIRVHRSRVKYETANARELATAVGRIQADLGGGQKEVETTTPRPKRRSKDAFTRIVAAASGAGDRRQRARAAAEGLTREFVLFSQEDWRHVAATLGLPNADDLLEELVRGNVVYEPKPRYYRTV